MYRLLLLALPLLLAAAPNGGGKPSPAADRDRLRGEVARLLGDLDSDRFEVRERAAGRLEELLAKPELGPLLAAEFRRRLVRPDLSFEVRRRLMRWSRQLPSPPAGPPGNASPKELDELIRQLDDDSYSVRLGAVQRLDWLLGNPKLTCPVMVRLKQRLATGRLGTEARRQLESVWERARGAWLLSDPAGWDLPAVSPQQIGQWLDALAEPAASGDAAGARLRCEAAQRELLDLLARDQYVPQLKKAVHARLAGDLAPDAAARLREMLDWTKPELVAEFWQGGRQTGEQHIVVGVPTLSPGALKPTHFDRADDRVAHYVSGNALSPGDYPIGEAFPNPLFEHGFFHLINLPTPRRRMAYLYSTQGTEAIRLAALSRRTLDHILADKRPLAEPELVMLDELDRTEVLAVRRPVLLAGQRQSDGRDGAAARGRPAKPLRHDLHRLADDGAKDAMPGLAEAIAKGRFLPPNTRGHYRLHWLAALSIAARDPWPATDAWLAAQVGQTELLIEPLPSPWALRGQLGTDEAAKDLASVDRASAAEVGATAAALLLNRRGQSSAQFGLQLAPEPCWSNCTSRAIVLPARNRGRRCGNGGKARRGRNPSPKPFTVPDCRTGILPLHAGAEGHCPSSLKRQDAASMRALSASSDQWAIADSNG